MGRDFFGPTHSFIPWCPEPKSQCNSQGLFDLYSFTHIIHGFFFYLLLWFFRKKISLGARLTLAVFLETLWEILENTPLVINKYRAETISLDYFGDSVINSISDIVLAIAGFWAALRLPLWVSVSIVVIIEVILVLLIRDNLSLNILLLVWPIEGVKNWQIGT